LKVLGQKSKKEAGHLKVGQEYSVGFQTVWSGYSTSMGY
jgi:hypothetical protein